VKSVSRHWGLPMRCSFAPLATGGRRPKRIGLAVQFAAVGALVFGLRVQNEGVTGVNLDCESRMRGLTGVNLDCESRMRGVTGVNLDCESRLAGVRGLNLDSQSSSASRTAADLDSKLRVYRILRAPVAILRNDLELLRGPARPGSKRTRWFG
jgi:hypothetical protein